jgi:deoxyribodipyrimidine photo-lyase
MWLASQWSVRAGWDWRDGEDAFFTHLLDGSRAANRLGWQWTVGTGTGRPYGFSRAQVTRRAPGLCRQCPHAQRCPIEDWPDSEPGPPLDRHPRLRRDDDPAATAGPAAPYVTGTPTAVWLTAESLGSDDPASVAHPDLPLVFVLDAPLLSRLRLSGKRLVFLTETLAELGQHRHLEVHRGEPVDVLADRPVAVTFAPVPGFRARAARIAPAVVHPYPWLHRPGTGPLTSFTAWRKHLGV